MKFSKYFMLAGAAALLAACSSEEPLAPDNSSRPDLAEVESYAYFNIGMQNDGTRTSSDKVGEAEEYAVKNGVILIFGLEGSNDDLSHRMDAKFVRQAALDFETATAGTAASGFDKQYTKVLAKFEKGTFSAAKYTKYYGVCVLNYDESASGNSKWLPSVQDGTITFKQWAENKDLQGQYITGNGFVMTNAALYDASATDKVKVLSPITTGSGYIEDEVKNLTAIAAQFTVQRIAAKVSLVSGQTSKSWEFEVMGKVNPTDENETQLATATITDWGLDLTRKTSYPVLNVWDGTEYTKDATNKYTVKSLFSTGATPFVERNRCMWGSGKYYANANTSSSGNYDATIYNRLNTTTGLYNIATKAYDYVRENTVNFDQMSKATVTRVVLKADYVLKDLKQEDLININGKVYATSDFADNAAAYANSLKGASDYTAELKNKIAAGSYNLSDILTIKKGENVLAATDVVYGEVAAKLGVYNNAAKEVNYYVNGECWYVVYIKHFGDETDDAVKAANGTLIAPNDYTFQYTGRYGIVRNNWYELSVNKISGIGYPTIPEPDPEHTPDDPGDRKYRNMQTSINILNWAKRSQNVDL